MELTILMPCLNEKLTLATCIRKAKGFLERAGIRGEVLIADNGSTDGSQMIALEEGARLIHVATRGYGAALIAGTLAARSTYVITGDSDDSYDFQALDPFVQKLREGFQLVMGDRFAGGILPGAMPALHRYLGNPVLSFMGRLFFRSPIKDFHCGLRGYHRESLLGLKLSCTGMEYASEMIVKSTLAGFSVAEVPTILSPDGRDRAPHLRSWRDGWRHLKFLLVYAPNWLFFYPGMLAFLAGSLMTVALIGGPIAMPFGAALDVHTMLYSMVLGHLGLQMVLFAGASSMHAVKIKAVPAMPCGLGWLERVSLENWLISAGAFFLSGLILAAWGVVFWAHSGFGSIDPSKLMRLTIPSASHLLAAGQLFSCGFLFEYLRLTPKDSEHKALAYKEIFPGEITLDAC